MKRLAALIALIVGALTAYPALATIAVSPANSNIGTNYDNGSATSQITTGTDAPVGSLIINAAGIAGTTTIVSVADNAGGGSGNCAGTYSTGFTAQTSAPTYRVGIHYCNVTGTDLPVGGHVTTTFGSGTGKGASMALLVTGAATGNPVDGTPASATGTSSGSGAQTLFSTITPSSSATKMALVCVIITGAANADTYTEDAAWSAVAPAAGSTTNVFLHCATKVVSTTSAQTWAPSWSTARTWAAFYVILNSPAAASHLGLLLLGVGQ